jgi:polysaccharide export outer membrane protein
MKLAIRLLLTITFAMLVIVPQQIISQKDADGRTTAPQGPNLPVQKVGRDDLIGISVYAAPELSGSARVEPDGCIRMPMLRKRIHAAGLLPNELEDAITKELNDEMVLVQPIVSVSVVEYRSRPITVSGAVKNPSTFQAVGTMTLLDAISTAGGLTENAGSEILVSHHATTGDSTAHNITERISVRSLLDGEDPAVNLTLEGGEYIRVPVAGEVYVVGNVRKPGSFYLTDGAESSILKALALSGGLDSYPKHTAYIYRVEDGKPGRSEIPVELKGILDRKTPDVPLEANDIFYVPDAEGRRISAKILESSLGISLGVASLILYTTR